MPTAFREALGDVRFDAFEQDGARYWISAEAMPAGIAFERFERTTNLPAHTVFLVDEHASPGNPSQDPEIDLRWARWIGDASEEVTAARARERLEAVHGREWVTQLRSLGATEQADQWLEVRYRWDATLEALHPLPETASHEPLSGRMRIAVVALPVSRVFLQFGPEAAAYLQGPILTQWGPRYGVRPLYWSGNEWQLFAKSPPQDLPGLRELAREFALVCPGVSTRRGPIWHNEPPAQLVARLRAPIWDCYWSFD